MENKRRALGKGLEELFINEQIDFSNLEERIIDSSSVDEIVELPIEELRPTPYQPRKVFDEEKLQELADSIREHGIFQPIIVKRSSIKGYEIIAGERRVRASKMAGLTTIPAIIRNLDDEQMMEIALLENLQRENLSSIEEAQAYKKMIDSLHLTQDELSKKVGKSRSHITNILGLLRLPAEVQEMVATNKISMGHARVLSKLESDDKIIEMAREIVEKKLPVRDIEQESEKENKKVKIERHAKSQISEFKYVEDLLREKLDTKVKIKDKKIQISFTNVADLNRILEVLDVKE